MIYATIYLAGVIIGLIVMRDSWGSRIATALSWPLGPLAFVIVVSVMLVVATILWPLVLVPFWLLVAALIWSIA
jgi:hypothetical protein